MTESEFECRLCAGGRCHVMVDLGDLPLANAFVSSPSDGADLAREPVTLVMCEDCRLLQLRHVVPPERLFENYLWTSSSSAAAHDHTLWLSRTLADRHPPSAYPRVVELASNDGLLLRHLARAGYDARGVEPSNLADEATAAGLPTVRAFFGREVAASLVADGGQADMVVARNVIGHVADLRGFLAGVAELLRPDGLFVVESPYAGWLRNELQYDTIFHEHSSYLTIATLCEALERNGLAPVRIGFVPMNGGSFLCEARRIDDGARDVALSPLLELERVSRLNDPSAWAWYGAAVNQNRRLLRELLGNCADGGATIAAYGAAAKTMTLFNVCGIGPDMVRMIADGNPRKQGLLCPGVRIPVVSPDELLASSPDLVLIGPWNLANEIVGQLRGRGYRGRFAVPLPVPHLLGPA
jgi:SAM-dependent methyltransferase